MGASMPGFHIPSAEDPFKGAKIYTPSFSWTSRIRQDHYAYEEEEKSPACDVLEMTAVLSGPKFAPKLIKPRSNLEDKSSQLNSSDL
jgi:hypothetical protein